MRTFIAASAVLLAVLTAAPAAADTTDRERFVDRPIKTLWQNNILWFGKPNTNPPEQIIFRQVSRPWLEQRGWFKNTSREACLLGVTRLVGPYGTSSFGVSRGCK